MATPFHWIVKLEEVSRPGPALLARQDEVMRSIQTQVLLAEWFLENVVYYYMTRRNDSNGVGLWLRCVQQLDPAEDIDSGVMKKLRAIVDHPDKLDWTGDFETRYFRNDQEKREFETFLRQTTDIALDLVRKDPMLSRQLLFEARVSTVSGDSQEFWDRASSLIETAPTYQAFDDEDRQYYEEMFLRIIKGQHWAHFFCNMVHFWDPHPSYDLHYFSENQLRDFVGI